MRVEVWSDVVCPWCYIGKRHLEAALVGLPPVEIVWRSFQLSPDAPVGGGGSVRDMLAAKYGMTPAAVEASQARVTAMAAAAGLDYHLEKTEHGNTFDAHRVLHLARDRGLQGELKERMLHAHFTEGRGLFQPSDLIRLATDVGLDPADVEAVLASDAYADGVRRDLAQAEAYGIGGVPFFVIDGTYGLSGAQPVEELRAALLQAAGPLQRAAGDAPACTDELCLE